MSNTNSGSSGSSARYSRLTAQIIRGGVKKRIYDIRKNKNAAARELLATLEEKLKKSINQKQGAARSAVPKGQPLPQEQLSGQNSAIINEIAATLAEGINLVDKLSNRHSENEPSVEELLLKILQSSRSAAEELIIRLATLSDAESLACFGTNLIYGGFLTETAAGSPAVTVIELSERRRADEAIPRIQSIIKNDLNSGRRVCVLRGEGLLSDQFIRIYRYFSDTAFILVDTSEKLPTVQGINNLLYIPEGGAELSPRQSGSVICGIAQFDRQYPSDSNRGLQWSIGKGSQLGGMPENSVSCLFKLLSSPSLPIKSSYGEFYSALCSLERMISRGKNQSPITFNL